MQVPIRDGADRSHYNRMPMPGADADHPHAEVDQHVAIYVSQKSSVAFLKNNPRERAHSRPAWGAVLLFPCEERFGRIAWNVRQQKRYVLGLKLLERLVRDLSVHYSRLSSCPGLRGILGSRPTRLRRAGECSSHAADTGSRPSTRMLCNAAWVSF